MSEDLCVMPFRGVNVRDGGHPRAAELGRRNRERGKINGMTTPLLDGDRGRRSIIFRFRKCRREGADEEIGMSYNVKWHLVQIRFGWLLTQARFLLSVGIESLVVTWYFTDLFARTRTT